MPIYLGENEIYQYAHGQRIRPNDYVNYERIANVPLRDTKILPADQVNIGEVIDHPLNALASNSSSSKLYLYDRRLNNGVLISNSFTHQPHAMAYFKDVDSAEYLLCGTGENTLTPTTYIYKYNISTGIMSNFANLTPNGAFLWVKRLEGSLWLVSSYQGSLKGLSIYNINSTTGTWTKLLTVLTGNPIRYHETKFDYTRKQLYYIDTSTPKYINWNTLANGTIGTGTASSIAFVNDKVYTMRIQTIYVTDPSVNVTTATSTGVTIDTSNAEFIHTKSGEVYLATTDRIALFNVATMQLTYKTPLAGNVVNIDYYTPFNGHVSTNRTSASPPTYDVYHWCPSFYY